MSSEEPSKRLEGTETSGEPSAGRTTRSLGRGLDEISHLFMATAAVREASNQDLQASRRAAIQAVNRVGAAVFRPGVPLMKSQLVATLKECQSALEDGMLAIAPGVSCGPSGDIDLLALDRSHQLTIIDVETTPSDGLLMRGISHVDWVVRNMPIVQRLHETWTIDRERQPRLVLVAPRFSPLLRSAIRQIAKPAVACFVYREIEHGGGTGIFVERTGGDTD